MDRRRERRRPEAVKIERKDNIALFQLLRSDKHDEEVKEQFWLLFFKRSTVLKENVWAGFPAESRNWSITVASVRNLEAQSHPQGSHVTALVLDVKSTRQTITFVIVKLWNWNN